MNCGEAAIGQSEEGMALDGSNHESRLHGKSGFPKDGRGNFSCLCLGFQIQGNLFWVNV